ncbi:MAG: serine/threonine protein kinase [Phototrophicaceae bacterium]
MIGSQIGPYEIIDEIGRGGMATVFRARQTNMDRFVALKIIHKAVAAESTSLDRFQREARLIARLEHPHILPVYDYNGSHDPPYIVMRYLPTGTLKDILVRDKLVLPETAFLLRQIATALDYAHRQGVIHRDIKPSNIMITGEGRAVLTDFGLALNTQEGTIGNTFGSVHYIAPEQAVSSAHAVPQSDLYALGVVLYEMLTGRVPFDDVSAMSIALKHISDPPPPPRAINPDISPELETVIDRILSKEPEDRYPTGAALVAALEQALASRLQEMTRTAPPDSLKAALPAGAIRLSDSAMTPVLQPWDAPASERRPPTRPRTGMLVVGALLSVAVIALLVLTGTSLLAGGDDDDDPTDTASPAVVADSVTATATATATAMASATMTTPATATDMAPATTTPRPTRIRVTSVPETLVEVTSGPSDTAVPATSTPDTTLPPIDAAGADDAEVLLRYDGRALVLYNRLPERWINVSDMVFSRTDASGSSVTYRAREWSTDDLYALRPTDCLMVWTMAYSMLPLNEFPSDICLTRQAFRQTAHPFWVSSQPDATFDVRVRGEIVATCPAVSSSFRDEMRCVVPIAEQTGSR